MVCTSILLEPYVSPCCYGKKTLEGVSNLSVILLKFTLKLVILGSHRKVVEKVTSLN